MVQRQLTIITPVYNDWESFHQLAHHLDRVVPHIDREVRILVVDDFSSQKRGSGSFDDLDTICQIDVLHLIHNVGHQRAIALGLTALYLADYQGDVIVMDADGEDQPDSILNLFERHLQSPDAVIVARRAKRTESLWFRLFYIVYKQVFRILVGEEINFGNFCLLPNQYVETLVYNSDLWNHFAATIKRARLPIEQIEIDRGTRYSGQSSMNFQSLVLHGLSALSVYLEYIVLRGLVFAALVGGAAFVGIVCVLLVLWFTDLAIPGWATTATGIFAIIISQMIIFSFMAIFFLLNNRSGLKLIPAIDAQKFIRNRESLRHCDEL